MADSNRFERLEDAPFGPLWPTDRSFRLCRKTSDDTFTQVRSETAVGDQFYLSETGTKLSLSTVESHTVKLRATIFKPYCSN